VVRAGNGREALNAIPETQPDVIVTDMIMPELDGLALVTEVERAYPHIPVVLMTSKGSEEIAGEALERGAASYVPKIHMSQHLVETVRRVLEMAEDTNQFSAPLHLAVRNDIEFVISNDVNSIRSVAVYLQTAVAGIAVPDRRQSYQLRSGVEEAMLNAMYHGNLELGPEELVDPARREARVHVRQSEAMYRDRRIFVHATIEPGRLAFEVRNEGPGFDVSRLPKPGDTSHFDHASGRGLALMRAFFDSVDYDPSGRQVRLSKQIVHPTDALPRRVEILT
jgi:CheY-like chemotaxis protein/anti-sigma regulatory factor (Ser/Thr protein kinase)